MGLFNFSYLRKRGAIIEIILCLAFIAALIVSTISSYRLSSFILKGAVTLVLALLYFLDSKYRSRLYIKDLAPKYFFAAVFGLLLIPSLTIIYSISPYFGIKKILNLAISTVPTIIFFYYILATLNPVRMAVFRILIIALSLAAVILSFLFSPFQYVAYKFSMFNWSHVIYGRFVGAAALMTFIFLIKAEDQKVRFPLLFITILLFSGVLFSGLRAAIIGLPLFSFIYIVNQSIKKQMDGGKRTVLIILILAAALSAYLFLNSTNAVADRLTNLTTASGLHRDGPIISRLEAYKISLNLFLNNPVAGLGIGGFKNSANGAITLWMNYPHNIILEVMAEYGTIGLLFFLFLAGLILSRSYKISFESLIFFLFMFWLAMFSKDLTTNTMFLAGTAFIGFKDFKLIGIPVSSFWKITRG